MMILVLFLQAQAHEVSDEVRRAHDRRIEACRQRVQAPEATFEDRLNLAKALHLRAVDASGQSAKSSREMLEALLAERPDDPLALAWLGSAWLLESRLAWFPGTKGRLAGRGLELLDQAVTAAEEDVEVRVVRAIAAWHLPDGFERRDQAAADLHWAAQRVEGALESGQIDAGVAAAAFLYAGEAQWSENNPQEARRMWQNAQRLGPETPSGIKARSRLAE